MKKNNWLKWIIVGGIFLLVLGFGASLFSPMMGGRTAMWDYDGCGSWGGGGMMNGWGSSGMMRYGGWGIFSWLLGLLLPLGFLLLLIAGGAWLFRTLTTNNEALGILKTDTKTCPSCGQPSQADWANCPYCGTDLSV
jgi:hypothetical protein